MRNAALLIFYFCALIIFGSCQRELHFPPTDQQPVVTLPQKDTVVTALTTYLPLTKNTFWRYRDSTTGKLSTLIVAGVQRTINSRPYETVSGSLYTSPVYYSVVGSDYYVHHELAGIEKEFLFLNDVKSVGTSWTVDMGLINGQPATGIGKIIEREKTIEVEGKIYQHVIHSQFNIYYQLSGNTLSYGGYNYYTARGIGIVKMQSRFGIDGVQTLFSDLKTLVDFSIQ